MATEPNSLKAEGFAAVLLSWRRWWRDDVVGTVDQATVIAKRRAECGTSARYLFMTAMSAGIAVLGLLLGSPAVVIGAMLLSPLMDPIIGAGFSLAIGDFKWLKESGRSLVWGSLIAVGLSALIVFFSPLQLMTEEIAARTRPNLFDLMVALFSALAGAYAMIRGRDGTIVGVAIATALMPPLAVVGFGLATLNWTAFSGALLLYVTNLVTIALIAFGMARFYGFRTSLSERQTQFQIAATIIVFVALAIPLFFSLNQIGREATAARIIRGEVVEAFGPDARVSQLDIFHEPDLIRVSATVLTPEIRERAQEESARAMERQLDESVQFTLQQFKVETGASAAEEAQLAAASAQERLASQRRAQDLADRLALIAGVPVTEVMVDRERRRALVRAKALPGAELGTYRALESRIAATEPEWKIEIRPPASALPQINLENGEPTDEGKRALELIKWSAQRMDAPVVLSGRSEALEVVAPLLTEAGVKISSEAGRGTAGLVSARWGAPDG